MGTLHWLFGQAACLAIILGSATGAITLALATILRNIRLAHALFALCFIWSFGCTMQWLAHTEIQMKDYLTAFFIGGTILVLWLASYRWVEANHKEQAARDTTTNPQQQGGEPKKPDVQQSTQGANSPNILGNNNIVTIGDPKIAAKLDEITRLLKAQGGRTAPEKLLAKYPLGYIIFDIEHENAVFPYRTHAFDNWGFDFTNVKVINSMADRVTIQMPDIYPKAGRSGPRIISPMITTPKKVGPFSVRYIFSDRDIALTGEVLAVKDGSMVFILGFVPAPKR
jgi:hypothetical protein